ncbi:hypothetical protein HMPREF1576_00623 [Gardnerella pickettii JCP7719]|uniref:Uncharacterized protein n=1 Tax=Gardnerella pickettii JCP7719 TaxID=1261061 RepID=S4I8J4_9BIFI|nr:hypothetical protein HMPREF1576_00623 [Gardnerella pickettii JCP7719]
MLSRCVQLQAFFIWCVGGLGVSCLTTLRLLRVVCCCGCSDLALILFLV